MKKIIYISFILTVLFISQSLAQQLEYMIPAGFNNPLLRSGQYITSLYIMDRYSKTDIKEDKIGSERGEYSFNFSSYVGLTDRLTLSARLYFYPEQTLGKSLYGGGGDQMSSFRLTPSFVLSYRPKDNFELFSAFDYSYYTVSYKASRTTLAHVIGVDEFGNPIYGNDAVFIPANPDMEVMSAVMRLGVTFTGSLW